MNGHRIRRALATTAVVGALPVADLVARLVGFRPSIEFATKIISFFVWAVTFIALRHQTVFLAIERAKRFVANTTCRWAYTARLELPDDAPCPDVFERAVEALLATEDVMLHGRDAAKNGCEAIFSLSSVPVILRLATTSRGFEEDDAAELVVDVPNSVTAYRNLRRVFEERLDPVVDELRRLSRPVAERYELAFSFPADKNPFFGAFVARLQPHGSFTWAYTKTVGSSTIQVTRNALELVTTNAAELRRYFKQLVGLSLAPARQ